MKMRTSNSFSWLSVYLVLLALLASIASGYAIGSKKIQTPYGANTSVIYPDHDPFYKPPLGFEKLKPGTILRHRRAPREITLDNKGVLKPKDAWQFLYRTQNSVGEPTATVVTLLVPHNPNPKHLFVHSYFTVR
jgi:hypothetical protein